MSQSHSKKILVIRFSSIGDIILTSPVLRCLKEQAHAEVHFLVKKKFEGAVLSNPYIDKIHTFGGSLKNTVAALRAEKFDLVIDLHKSLRSYLIRSFLMRKSYAYRKLRIKRWFRTKGIKSMSEDRHVSDRFVDTLQKLGVINDGKGLDFFIDSKSHVDLELLPQYKSKVALIPGAQHLTKRMPSELLHNIIKSKPDTLFYILGGSLESEIGDALSVYDNVSNYCGKLSLEQSASVIDQQDYVIAGDTGLMHIAAARNKDIILLWGSTVKEFGFYPYYGNSENVSINIENKNLDCRPCTKIGKEACPRGHFNCMKELSTSDVVLAMNELSLANHL